MHELSSLGWVRHAPPCTNLFYCSRVNKFVKLHRINLSKKEKILLPSVTAKGLPYTRVDKPGPGTAQARALLFPFFPFFSFSFPSILLLSFSFPFLSFFL